MQNTLEIEKSINFGVQPDACIDSYKSSHKKNYLKAAYKFNWCDADLRKNN